jgi:hypothetical protein
MSFQAQTWVIDNSKHKGSALLVLLMIANHAHADGTNAFPSLATLAKECRMSDRQITRIIQTLEASGEVNIARSAGRSSHRYSVVMSKPIVQSNPDILSGSPEINLSQMSPSTLTSAHLNPDKSVTNPDIAVSPELTIEPKNLKENTHTPRTSATPAPQSANAGVCV